MLDVLAADVVGMDEGVEVAVLQLHRGLDAVAAGDLGHLLDDAQAVVDVALVVVGHLEDEEKVREGLGHAVLLWASRAADSIQAWRVAREIIRSST